MWEAFDCIYLPGFSLTTEINVSLTSMCRWIVIVAFVVAAAVNVDAVGVCNGLGFDLFSPLDSSDVIIRIRKHKKLPQSTSNVQPTNVKKMANRAIFKQKITLFSEKIASL